MGGRGWSRTRRLGASLLTAAFGMALCGWARPADAGDMTPALADVHTLGVSSDLGDVAEVKRSGPTIFNYKITQLPIADWALNDLAVRQVEAALAGRYTVRPTQIDDKRFQWTAGNWNIRQAVQALPPADVDAYLILLPTNEFLPYPSKMYFWGPGVFSGRTNVMYSPNWPNHGDAVVHMTYSIYLVRAKTGEIIAQSDGKFLSTEKGPSLGAAMLMGAPQPIVGPHLDTGDNTWPMTADALSEAQKQVVRHDLETLIQASIPYTLADMGLAAPRADPAVKP